MVVSGSWCLTTWLEFTTFCEVAKGEVMEMNLFEPITIRGMQLRNRIVMSPMSLGIGLGGQRPGYK